MLKELDDYDWAEVFGEGGGGNCTTLHPEKALGDQFTNCEPFGREDVKVIIDMEEGENDGLDWIIWGTLKDGRYFIARGGCDYTGWDCRASNSADVASTQDDIIRFGMSRDERERFDVLLEDDI